MPGDALPAGRPAASAGPARQRCLPATPTGCYKRPRRGIVTNALVTSNFVGSRDQARCHVSAKRQGGAPQALRGRRAGRAGRARGEDGVGAHDPRHARHFPAAGMRRAARARVGHAPRWAQTACVRVQRIYLKSVRRCSRAQAVCLNFWSPLLFYMIPVALLASLILWVSVYYNWKRGAPPPVCVRAPGHACRPGMRPQRA